MSKCKAIGLIALISLALSVSARQTAVCEEKGKVVYRNVWYTTDVQSAEVPDVEGHTVHLAKAKGISFNEKWGHALATLSGTGDTTKGVGSYEGYMHYTFPDGSTITEKYKGETKPSGAVEGTGTYVKGTGKFQGIKGEGTWKVWFLGPGQFYGDLEVEYTLP